jgi:hypothetical protein
MILSTTTYEEHPTCTKSAARYDIVSINKHKFGFVEKQPHEENPALIRKRGAMQSRLLAYEHATTVNEIALWANSLIDHEVPGDPSYVIISIQQFQLISSQSTYDAMILFEVTHNDQGTEVALKESDIQVIEELTSAIDEPS